MEPCVLWDDRVGNDGYGRLEKRLAHTVLYERAYGPIPKGYEVHHLCDTPLCINLDHLVMITTKLHRYITPRMRNGVLCPAPINQTHCINGHPYNDNNTYIRPTGQRDCRQCIRERVKRYSEKQRAEAA